MKVPGQPLVFLDGELVPAREARISVFDRGFLYGDGVFETLACFDGVPEFFDEHHDRLREACAQLRLEPGYGRERLREAVSEVAGSVGAPFARARISVTRGVLPGLAFPAASAVRGTCLVTAEAVRLDPRIYAAGMRVKITSVRNPVTGTPVRRKSLAYLGNVVGFDDAVGSGYDDGILLGWEGDLAELATANLFFASEGRLVTPPVSESVLGGIVRAKILELARRDGGFAVEERKIFPGELGGFTECFLTSSLKGIAPIVEIDGRPVGAGRPGPLYGRLSAAFAAARAPEARMALINGKER